MNETFTAVRAALDERVSSLPGPPRAALLASAARGLMPVYDRFAERQGWGDAEALRLAIAEAESYALSGHPGSDRLELLAARVEAATPHGDDFDDPETTGAQDAAITADVALRVARGLPTEGMLWYALEHLDQVVTFDRTRLTDVGSGPRGDRWEAEILGEPRVASALEVLDHCLERLRHTDRVDQPMLDELREGLRVLDPSAGPDGSDHNARA